MYTLCEVDVKTVDKCRNCETSVSGESDRLRNHKIKRGAVTKNTPHKRSLDTNDIDSQLICVDTYIRNRPFMLLIIAQNEHLVDLRIRNLVRNVGLYNEAKHLEEQLKPIAVAMDSLQADIATIADACEQWCAILLHAGNVLETHKAKITKRFNQATYTLTHQHASSNLPRYESTSATYRDCSGVCIRGKSRAPTRTVLSPDR